MATWWLLWSINERLGSNPGIDFEEPSLGWIEDLRVMGIREAERDVEKRDRGVDAEMRKLFEG